MAVVVLFAVLLYMFDSRSRFQDWTRWIGHNKFGNTEKHTPL